MNDQFNVYSYIQQVQELVSAQNERIARLEVQVKELSGQIAELKSKPPQNIEYKFDQLKIERLDGTLNIGITPSSDDAKDLVEQFSAGQNTISTGSTEWQTSDPFFSDVRSGLEDYFKEEIIAEVKKLENEMKFPLEESYRIFMVEDIQRQIPERLEHYRIKYDPQDEEGKQMIVQKTKEDVMKSITAFMEHLKKSMTEGGGENEFSSNQH
ncbi:spore germination protein GerPC [Fictibacillus iocasae]|uniref:Spore germination protein GerPC n=1 Tax=Fictibacillus iocasae TaxID=2715437 RepID=A0ABW2NVF4_9BACL